MKTVIINSCSTMKSIFKYFVPMTAAVIALAACNREQDPKKDIPQAPELHITVKAAPDQVKGDAQTKTYISAADGRTILWGTGEYMKIGVYDGTETTFGESSDASSDLWVGESEALFTFSITPATASNDYTYYGLYPASAASTSSNTNPASYKVILPATQSATATSYDPKAYILVAKPESGKTVYDADWEASFRRATALNKITLKNLSEDIKRVKITAPTGTYLAGGRHIDLTTGFSDDIYNGGGRTETVDVRYSTKLSGGADMDIWFTSWEASIAVDAHLVIVAYSDEHTFTRDITVVNKPITFLEGYLNTLSVDMASATQADNTELEEGNYVVLAKNNSNYYALKAEETTGSTPRLVSMNYNGDLDSYDGESDIVWFISRSGNSYTIKNGANYLGWKGGNSASLIEESDYTDSECLMDISYGDGFYTISINNDSSRLLARNTSNAYFAFYSGTQYKEIVFVPAIVDNRQVVTLSFEDGDQHETSVVNLTTDNYDEFLGLNLVADPDDDAITNNIVWDCVDNDGVIDELDGGVVILTGNEGTATVTASFEGDANYRAATASYTINVSSASTASEVFEKITSISDLTLGDTAEYLLIYVPSTGTPLALDGSLESGYNGSAGVGVSFDSDGNADYNTYKSYALTISAASTDNKYWIKTAGGVFIGRNANSNGVDEYTPTTSNPTPTSNYDNGISFNSTTGVVSITGNGGRALLYYPNNSNYRYYAASNLANMFLYKHVTNDNREDPGMSWSAEAATATYGTGNTLSFTAPTLTLGNASNISFASTDETIATITATGAVTIEALVGNEVKEGSTTIKAIFAGDDNYKPQTVSYTLTVVDAREAVAAPTFSPAAGEVEANAQVTINSVSGATVYYTVNGSNPTTESTLYEDPITIDGAKTIKAIAVLSGYKPSAVAEAAYTVAGVQANDGSLEHPYTADEAYTQILAGNESTVYVTGTVVSVGSLSNGVLTYWISEDGTTTNQIQVYKGKYLGNVNFSSADQLASGDNVLVYGPLKYYNNTTPEINSGSQLISINGKTKVLTAGTLTATPDNDNKQITVDWGAASGTESAISYVVTCGTQSYNADAAGSHTFTMADYGSYQVSVTASADDAISVTASTSATLTDPSAGTTDKSATIKFGSANGSTAVNSTSVTGDDSQGNTWTITTVTNNASFTQNASYSQIGSSNKPATSITFTTTLSKSATIKAFSAKFGGFNGTAGTVTLKVDDTTVGSGSLNGSSDVTVSATDNTAVGTVLTVTVTGISKGVKAYEINVTYNN